MWKDFSPPGVSVGCMVALLYSVEHLLYSEVKPHCTLFPWKYQGVLWCADSSRVPGRKRVVTFFLG